MSNEVENALAQNRAEELGYDVWQHFVIPLFFDKLDFSYAKKPRIVTGGRGCGKTMLLRYLSYASAFSSSREHIPAEALDHIGVYWRADTQFANTMTGGIVPENLWRSAFQHSLALNLGGEILKSLLAIAASKADTFSEQKVRTIDFSMLRAFDPGIPSSFDDLMHWLKTNDWALQSWINNPDPATRRTFLPCQTFLRALIGIIQEQLIVLRSTSIFVYIDEYENLLRDQQKVINTFLKHSEPPLIFNLAMKRYGMKTKETVGEESIVDIADYRTYDLDTLLSDKEFSVYAAEILFVRLARATIHKSNDGDDELKNPSSLPRRRRPNYQTSTLRRAKELFPGLTQKELAEHAFRDPALVSTLRKTVAARLKRLGSNFDPGRFVLESHKEAAIIIPALLHRKGARPDEILEELAKLVRNEDNKFTGKTDWIHNNFYGCLLQLYAPYDRPCPVYAGFDAYISLASGNLRHFLELCYKALKRRDLTKADGTLKISIDEQAEAAKQASTAFMTEIRGFGRLGNRLHSFVLTLGSLFAILHRRPTQSEPEITHFSVSRGTVALTEEDDDFFREALKWSVLQDTPATKLKNPFEPPETDWILNPIYAPYFHISYRKKRKLQLSSDDIITAIRGNPEQKLELFKRYELPLDGQSITDSPLLFGTEAL